jgi:hypothetical protein
VATLVKGILTGNAVLPISRIYGPQNKKACWSLGHKFGSHTLRAAPKMEVGGMFLGLLLEML